MHTKYKLSALACALGVSLAGTSQAAGYEVWASDQTNTQGIVYDGNGNPTNTGTHGGRALIYDSNALDGVDPNAAAPLVLDVTADLFPNALADTGSHVIRLHGMLPSPDHKYMNLNFVTSGHLGIVDGETKQAVCLFRSTGTTTGRQNHMSFWTPDYNHLVVANQAGKMMERVDISHDAFGNVTGFDWNQDAALDLVGGRVHTANPVAVDMNPSDGISCTVSGTPMTSVTQPNTFTLGSNTYNREDATKRPNNQLICPIAGSNGLAYATLGGGGMFVVNPTTEPMSIVAAYDKTQFRAAGCGGMEGGGYIHLNAGTSGANISEFTVYRFPLLGFPATKENKPTRTVLFADADNGQVIVGNNRDAHGMSKTDSRTWLHQFDRVRNNVRTIHMGSTSQQNEYSLTTEGVCGQTLGAAIANDPTPDLLALSPNGNRFYVALRGPNPLTITHAAVGSCPGVGIVEITDGGKSGKMTHVLPAPTNPGLVSGVIKDLADVHGAAVRLKDPVAQN